MFVRVPTFWQKFNRSRPLKCAGSVILQMCTSNPGIDPRANKHSPDISSFVVVNAGKLELTRVLLPTKHLHSCNWVLDDISKHALMQGSDVL